MRIGDGYAAREQIVNHALIAFLLEEMIDRSRDFAADVGHELEQRPWQMAHEFEFAEPSRERLRRALADMHDAERIKKTRERGLAARNDRGDQIFRPLRCNLAGLDPDL